MSQAAKIFVFSLLAGGIILYGYEYNTRPDRQIALKAQEQAQRTAQLQSAVLERLKKEDLIVGTGAEAKPGDTVSLNYTASLSDGGAEFDSSKKQGKPLSFTIGAQQVIPGWDLGVQGMKVGGKRKISVPPELGYGPQGSQGGEIPPNATIYFTVELVSITPAS